MSDRVQCSAAPVYRDRYMATDRQYHVTDPDGQMFAFCSGACLLTYAVHGSLPADIKAVRSDQEGEAA